MFEETYNAIRELKGKIDGVGTVVKFLLEQINGKVIEAQMKIGSNDLNSFEANIHKIANGIDMLETKIMHLLSNR